MANTEAAPQKAGALAQALPLPPVSAASAPEEPGSDGTPGFDLGFVICPSTAQKWPGVSLLDFLLRLPCLSGRKQWPQRVFQGIFATEKQAKAQRPGLLGVMHSGGPSSDPAVEFQQRWGYIAGVCVLVTESYPTPLQPHGL